MLAALIAWLARDEAFVAPHEGGVPAEGDEPHGPREALVHEEPKPAPTNTAPDANTVPRPGPHDGDRPVPAHPTGALEGRVLDRKGDPVFGARVFAVHAPELGALFDVERAFASHRTVDAPLARELFGDVPVSTTTGSDGRFTFDALPPGRVRLAVVSPDHARFDRDDLLVAPKSTTRVGDIELVEGVRARLSTQIPTEKDPERNEPGRDLVLVERSTFADASLPPLAARACVVLGTGEAEGVLASTPLGPGVHELALFARGARTESMTLDAGKQNGEWAPVTLARGAKCVVALTPVDPRHAPRRVRALPRGSRPSVVPVDLRDDARVAAFDEKHGVAVLDRLESAVAYEVRSASGAQTWEERSPWNPPALLFPGEPFLQLPFRPDAALAGVLTTSESSAKLERLVLRVLGAAPEREYTLDDAPLGATSAAFELTGLRPAREDGAVLLEVRSAHHARTTFAATLVSGEKTTVDTRPLAPPARVRLRVVSASDGRPVAGARVTCRPLDRFALEDEDGPFESTTDEHGVAELSTFGLANSLVRFDAAGFALVERGFEPQFLARPSVEVPLPRAVRVRVRVVDGAGVPIPGARVERDPGPWSPTTRPAAIADTERAHAERWDLEREADADHAAWTDAHGVATFPRVAPGQHAFHVERHARILDGEWTSRDLPPTDDVAFDLVSVARVVCEGRLVEGDEPLAFAELSLSHAEDVRDLRPPDEPLPPGLDARTDAGGAFRFENVPPGEYRLAVRVPRQRWRHVETLHVPSAPKPFVLDVAANVVNGVVVDAQGTRAPFAVVEVQRASGVLPKNFRAGATTNFVAAYERVTECDGTGAFRITGLPSGEPLLLRARRGASSASKVVLVSAPATGGPTTCTLELEARGRVELAFDPRAARPSQSADDALPSDAFVLLVPGADVRGEPAFASVVPVGGQAAFAGLAPGAWTLYVVSTSTLSNSASARLRGLSTRLPPRLELDELLGDVSPESAVTVTIAADEAAHVELGAH